MHYLLLIICLLASNLVAQELEIGAPEFAVSGAVNMRVVGDMVLIDRSSKISVTPVYPVTVKSDTPSIQLFAISNASFLASTQAERNKFYVSCPRGGPATLVITLVDFDSKTSKQLIKPIDFGPSVEPLPGPSPIPLTPFANEVKNVFTIFIDGMAKDMETISSEIKTGSLKSVLDAGNRSTQLDTATRSKFKQSMANLMQPRLGNDILPKDALDTFQQIANGFRGVK